ncbi:TPA: H(+)-transporting ATPase [Candidatus Avacholeplasma faecigallinarum]|nr:H(+)-transporting ATPase [Candidatus Avacholeplasma faecigallinarum]
MKKKKIHPYVLIILTFLGVILIGTGLIALPISSTSGKSFGFVDSLFMVTSAVCVTGLTVMDMSAQMTPFGFVVMALLMEIGGLSIITIAVFFFIVIGAKISVGNRFLLRESLNQNSVGGIVGLVRRIVLTSVTIQLIGVVINMFAMMPYTNYDFFKALGYSVFHSVAAFNNAGFDIFGPNSMIPFAGNVILNASTIFLIVVGGIGFVVINDIIKKRSFKKLRLHSKIVLITTLVLILGGMVLLKLTMNEMTWLQALFTSVTSRTAGFTTVDLSTLTPGAYLVVVILMFIGTSPCSTGGGVKTTTIFVIVATIFYFAKGKKTKAFGRRIPDGAIFKAFVLVTLAMIVVVVGTFAICIIQPQLGVQEVIFEVVSAFSTTGLSMGITTSLNKVNRLIISLLMFLGRIGPLTVIGVVNKNWMTDSKEDVQYVEEKVIIG